MAIGGSAHSFTKAYNSKSLLVQKIGKTFLFQGKLRLNHRLELRSPQKHHFMPVLCLRTGQSLKNVG
jgi:hypothetical protein